MEDIPNYPGARAIADRPMPAYVTVKLVHALKIAFIQDCPGDTASLHFEDKSYEPLEVSREWVKKRGAQPGGYFVAYEDGYTSWSPADAFEKCATPADQWGIPRSQEPKYTVNHRGRLINRNTSKPIPDHEPLFVLRGQDKLALPTVVSYRGLAATAAPDSAGSVDERVLAFNGFAEGYPAKMKYPTSRTPAPPVPTSINAVGPVEHRAAWPFPTGRRAAE